MGDAYLALLWGLQMIMYGVIHRRNVSQLSVWFQVDIQK